MIQDLPTSLLLQVVNFLPLEAAVLLAQTCSAIYRAVHDWWAPQSITFTFELRQRVRKQIFDCPRSLFLPSHFSHVFHSYGLHGLLPALLKRRNRLRVLAHERSAKRMKLHHPYFYRQLPLAITPEQPLSEPVLNPDDIPLPHDLSMSDIMYLMLLNARSLERVDLQTFDTAPLPWNSTPSRVCPRDLLRHCSYEKAPGAAICVWCPDCKPAQRDHACCWQLAGGLLIDRLLNLVDPETSEQLRQGLAGGPSVVFAELRDLAFHGWGLTNFLAFLRAFSVADFPKLRTLSLGGTIIMSPGLTDNKDTEPRPFLRRDACPEHTCPVELNELQEKLAQILSFHVSPYARYGYLVPLPPPPTHTHVPAASDPPHTHTAAAARTSPSQHRSRRFDDAAVEQYWMGHFNGHLWRPEGFPELRVLSLRVGNFDDSCRWITPMMQNCFALCPKLEVLELDHTILHPLRTDNPLLKLFSLCSDPKVFPALRVLKLKMVESAVELSRIQNEVSSLLGRPIILKTRKLFLRLASRWASEEAALIRHWVCCQRVRISTWLQTQPAEVRANWQDLSDEDLSLWNDVHDGSAKLILSFDAHDPQAEPPAGPLGRNWESTSPQTLQSHPILYGGQVAKITLKHFTPTNPLHAAVLTGIRFVDAQDTCGVETAASVATVIQSPVTVTHGGVTQSQSRTVTPDLPRQFSELPPESLSTAETTDGSGPRRLRPLKRLTVQLDLPQVWQVTEEEAKASVVTEITALRRLIVQHPDLSEAQEARVMSCTRLTYGGSNWGWWEELICGRLRPRERAVEAEGWVRESSDIVTQEQLRVYKCDHVWGRHHTNNS